MVSRKPPRELSDAPMYVWGAGIPRHVLDRLTADDKAWIREQLERVDIKALDLGPEVLSW